VSAVGFRPGIASGASQRSIWFDCPPAINASVNADDHM
jgi:hypothetical protein